MVSFRSLYGASLLTVCLATAFTPSDGAVRDTAEHLILESAKGFKLHGRTHRSRWLQPSDECRDDRQALMDNAAIREAKSAAEIEAEEAAQNCLADTSETPIECEFDADDFDSVQDFRDACQEAGGNVYEADFDFQCTVSGNGQSVDVNLEIVNDVGCDANNCSRDAVISGIEEDIDVLEANLTSTGGAEVTTECTLSYTVRNPEGETIYSSSKAASLTNLLVTLAALLAVVHVLW